MKKISIIYLLLSLLFLSGCSIIKQMSCDHQFTSTIEESTCSKNGFELFTCELCGYHKKEVLPTIPHEYESKQIEATCDTDGGTLNICKVCGYQNLTDVIAKLGHDYTEWKVETESTGINDGLKTRECLRCGHIEEQIIPNGYISLDVLKLDYKDNITYTVNDYEELLLLFEATVLNRSLKLNCVLKYDYGNFDTVLQSLVDDCSVSSTFKVSSALLINNLELTFNYEDIPTTTTSKIHIEQYSSKNYEKYNSSRTSNFDDFAINKSKYSYKVSTTEQLVYVLERNVKPICEKGSAAENVYNKIKSVLIEIIDDNMTDIEKVKAIHDWIILNVVYDHELLNLVYQNKAVGQYNGFYLEGVFEDKKAVCEGIAKAFLVMANIEGIPCVLVEGKQASNPNGVGHAWNKVFVDNKWYIIDATSDGTIINNEFEVLSYAFFLIDEATMNKTYIQTNYKNIVCNSKYDYYKNNNLAISNMQELVNVVKDFGNSQGSKKTLEIRVEFDFGKTISEELQTAYSSAGIFTAYSYIENGNIIILLK